MFRPGLLLCERKEARVLERVAQKITPMLDWVAGGRLSIATSVLAKVMVADASQGGSVPFTLLHNKDILSKSVY